MIKMEERINYLDGVMAELAHAQLRTEITVKDTSATLKEVWKRMDARDASMEDLWKRMDARDATMDSSIEEIWKRMDTRDATRDSAIEEVWERMDARDASMDSSIEEIWKRMDARDAEMKSDTRKMQKAWGDLANKLGTVAEDVVAPNIPRLAREEFGFSEVEDLMVRARRASRRGGKRLTEYDIVCSGPEKVIVVEVKSTPTLDKIHSVNARLDEFFDFFPEYEGRELIGIFASWSIDDRLLPAISKAGLYGIAMGEETMDVVARPLT